MTQSPYLNTMALCVDFYRNSRNYDTAEIKGSDYYKKLSKNISEVFLSYASLVAINHSNDNWGADNDYPGYVSRMGHGFTVRVPFHLAPLFPSQESLAEIWKVSRHIKTSDRSTLCLAGSLTAFRAIGSYSDVDFCEYIPVESQEINQMISEKVTIKAPIACFSLDLCSVTRPDADGEMAVDGVDFGIDPSVAAKAFGKIDYLASVGKKRIIEATNVMLFTNKTGGCAARDRTFQPQETILENTAFIPHYLCCPLEVGRYVDWLRSQILKYLDEENFTKAIKRSISLASFLGLQSSLDAIKKMNDSSSAFIEYEIAEMKKLMNVILNNKEIPEDYIQRMEAEIKARSFDLEAVKIRSDDADVDLNEIIGHIANDLLGAFDEITGV